ncbi:MAG: M48 family metalloprotease [Gammaproteobacteria bacterium]|nr:M48 family metalloprotease [Gammaproteobacteria bacterium]
MNDSNQKLVHTLGWFSLVNLGIFIQASLSLSILGLDGYLSQYGISMLEISLGVAGIGVFGALVMILASKPIICLFLKPTSAKNSKDTKVQQLRLIVEIQAEKADIPVPSLAVYSSEEINAFAIGTGGRHSMLVVSQKLLDSLSLDELSAVVGHELTHIANGDMLTLTLIQGVVNMCVHFPAHILGQLFDRLVFRDPHRAPVTRAISIILQLLLAGLASLVVMWFSRQREFTADVGGAKLAGHGEMMAALRSLQTDVDTEPSMYPFVVFGMNSHILHGSLLRYFSSHPSIQERIQALAKVQ